MTIPEGFKPMLAVEHSKVKTQNFPYYLSEKLDGIRCIVFDGAAYSRSLKLIPNLSIQAYVNYWAHILEGFDGELALAEIVWEKAERAMQGKPVQEPVLLKNTYLYPGPSRELTQASRTTSNGSLRYTVRSSAGVVFKLRRK